MSVGLKEVVKHFVGVLFSSHWFDLCIQHSLLYFLDEIMIHDYDLYH